MEPKDIAKGCALFVGILFFLYFFLVSLDIMGSAFKVLSGDLAGDFFSFANNPIAGLMVGIIATVLVQSSSTTTSVIVSAVGAGVLPVETAIPMVMGANIGTSVTNTIVSLGFVANREQLRLGFAGATVHDMFNYMNVILWLPLESIVSAINSGNGGILFLISEAITANFEQKKDCVDDDGNAVACPAWTGPLKTITSPVGKSLIDADKDVTKDFANGSPDAASQCTRLCTTKEDVTTCKPYKFNRKKCVEDHVDQFGITCNDKKQMSYPICSLVNNTITFNEDVATLAKEHYDTYKLNKGGALADAGWSSSAAGIFCLILSLIMLIVCLVGMVKLLGIAVRGSSERVLKKALNMNGYLAILVGAGVTIFVQSSSITTSTLTPLVAIGTLTVEGMLPLTLGANIGTTVTGILAALVSDSKDGFQIAMVHVLFNVFGVVLFYPFPPVRSLPIRAAKRLGNIAAVFKPFPIVYIFMLFLVYPGAFLGISIGFTSESTGGIVGGVIGLILLLAAHAGFGFWYFKKDGAAWLEASFGHDFDDEKAVVSPTEDDDDIKLAP